MLVDLMKRGSLNSCLRLSFLLDLTQTVRERKSSCSKVSKWSKILEFQSKCLSMTVHVRTAGHQVPFVVMFANEGRVEDRQGRERRWTGFKRMPGMGTWTGTGR